ncbi:transmembrane anterior posterior transformation protein 1 homolog [Mizuhopecten yessoensis]|uniref:Transmembrane anterior posterior transformation protein 1 n=1 Tax=Mizuhopecten yessoensis TaxID=6573 RepID=A0A210QSL0_MIZYE|nr:transmembrane anterior posterior transformation protein 1 homolog [Mizuhopecten yessoensis]OWF51710.1 Transmembrane anterior posterior transformation protein 1 [Mizuhopecten yessoensis]
MTTNAPEVENLTSMEDITEPEDAHFPKKPEKLSVFGYVTSELTRGYMLERDKVNFTERRQRVYTIMKTPRELEKFIVFGFFQLVDAFLFLFTFLPLRIVLALLKIITHPCGFLMPKSPKVLEPAQICDILKGIILLVSFFIINYIDTSMMYHLVRGQAIVKLYVFFNMLDMADRLFSSFGQDILDSLYWTAMEPRDKKRQHFGVIPHLLLAILYVIIHCLLILFQATVLNVAFNSHNKALLTIMMSNNFVEIKGSLFRKIDKELLYHISCSDVKERFHYTILLAVVFIRNMTEFNWNIEHVWVIIPDAVIVLCAELCVDWVKHAFILKFNEMPADIYHTYKVRLSEDMISNRQSRAYIDYSDMVARRMGFTPLPLACLLVRICTKSFKVTGTTGALVVFLLFLCLITFKILNSIILLGQATEMTADPGSKAPEDKSMYKDVPPSSPIHRSKSDQHLQISHTGEFSSTDTISADNQKEMDHSCGKTSRSKSETDITICASHEKQSSFQIETMSVSLNKNVTFSEGFVDPDKTTIDKTDSEGETVLSEKRYSSKHDEKIFPSFNFGEIKQRNVSKD